MPSSLARTRPELDEIPLSTVMMTSGRMASAAASYSMAGASPYLVNQKRAAVQRELTQRPPTPDELGVRLPSGSKLQLEQTARQIAQYHPAWRIYEYRISMSRADFIEHFQQQGLSFSQSANQLKFGNTGGDFIDGFTGDSMSSFRIWRKPQ